MNYALVSRVHKHFGRSILTLIKFSNGQRGKVELEVSEGSSNAIRLANGWLNDGVSFEEAIAAACALCTHCRWAAVSQLEQDTSKVNILALIDNDSFVDCFSYDFNKTPCEQILGQDKFCHFSGVQHAFPEDEDLKNMGVADYAGSSFRDDSGCIVGHIFVMSDKPMTHLNEIEETISAMTTLLQLEWPSTKHH